MSYMKYEAGGKVYYVPAIDITDAYNDAYDDAYESAHNDGKIDGASEENSRFWNMIQANGNRANYSYAFMGWDCEEIKPLYKVAPSSGSTLAMVFASNPTLKTVSAEYFDFSQANPGTSDTTGCYGTFMACGTLETIEDIGMPAPYGYNFTFANCNALKTIAKMRVNSNTKFNKVFNGCTSLETLIVEGTIGQNGFGLPSDCSLSATSLESIINALEDKSGTSGTTWTITLGTTNVAKLTDAQKQTITSKGWTYS